MSFCLRSSSRSRSTANSSALSFRTWASSLMPRSQAAPLFSTKVASFCRRPTRPSRLLESGIVVLEEAASTMSS